MDFPKARVNMIDGQLSTSGVVNEQILESFSYVPREMFVPQKLRDVAYIDESLDIGQGRFLLSPIVYSKMVQAANPCGFDVVLDIGSAYGYSSAILSPLVTTVIALEHNKRQMDKAAKLWEQLGVNNIVLSEGELANGVPEQAPYSLIIINGAVSEVPKKIIDQIDVGGRLVAVVREDSSYVGCATLFIKSHNGDVSCKKLFDANIPFIKGFEPSLEFEF